MEANKFFFLKIVGVGYKATKAEGHLLFLKLWYNHEVEQTVHPSAFKANGKERVHQFAIIVCYCKLPNVYKGKDTMYVDKVIKKKQERNQYDCKVILENVFKFTYCLILGRWAWKILQLMLFTNIFFRVELSSSWVFYITFVNMMIKTISQTTKKKKKWHF